MYYTICKRNELELAPPLVRKHEDCVQRFTSPAHSIWRFPSILELLTVFSTTELSGPPASLAPFLTHSELSLKCH